MSRYLGRAFQFLRRGIIAWLVCIGILKRRGYGEFEIPNDSEVAIVHAQETGPAVQGDQSGSESAVIQDQENISAAQEVNDPDGVQYNEPVRTATSEQEPIREHSLNSRTINFGNDSTKNQDLSDLDAAIGYAEAALAASMDNANRAAILQTLSGHLNIRYKRSGDLSDLHSCITHAKAALEVTPANDCRYSSILESLSDLLEARYQRLGDLKDLEEAIENAEASLIATPIDQPERADRLESLGNCLDARYRRFGDLKDLGAAIGHAEAALVATPEDHPDRAVRLHNLSVHFIIRYKRLGDPSDLGEAIRHAKEAVEATTDDHPHLATRLFNLAFNFRVRYMWIRDLSDLEAAISYAEAAITASPVDESERASMLSSLGNYFNARYQQLGELEDLRTAIEHTEAALAATHVDNPGRADYFSNLSTYFEIRYQRLGALEDLQTAIEHAEAALKATPVDSPDRAHHYSTLSRHLGSRYERLGALDDLGAAIKHAEAALILSPVECRAHHLSNLSSHLQTRYDRLGGLEDLEVAIDYAEEALTATPSHHLDRVSRWNSLSACFKARYWRFRALSDLETAIEHAEAALAAVPLDHLNYSGILGNLGILRGDRYERLRTVNDLESAIEYLEAALAETPADHPNRAVLLSSLSKQAAGRFWHSEDPTDLTGAIEYATAALAATPNDNPLHIANRSHSLSHQFSIRYEKLGNLGDLTEAIKHAEVALEATPDNYPQRALRFVHLGQFFQSRYQKTGFNEDREKSFRSFLAGWNCDMSPPIQRVLAAWKTAQYAPLCHTWQESSSILEGAVRMMSKISSRSLEREDQQSLLAIFYGISSDAASVALEAGQSAYHALKLLELGRGITNGFAIDYRSELVDLQLTNPDLFDSLTRLQIEINAPLLDESKDQRQESLLSRREQAIKEIETVLSDIRQIPIYKDFLLPPAPETLMKMAEPGPIVIFNTTRFRSDAIIVTASTIKTLSLSKLLYAEAAEKMTRMNHELVKGSLRTYASRNNEMKKLLLWLWDVAVEPVLHDLQLTGVIQVNENRQVSDATDILTRIWWIGVGELSTAPFHAAGDHAPGSTRNTISRIVSSYIPTIKALSYAREKALDLVRKQDPYLKLLLVTMPKTPGESDLPMAEKEVEAIVDIARKVGSVGKGSITTTVLKQPNAAEVLGQLESYKIVHFACHGISENKNPLNSNLVLLSRDPRSAVVACDRLTVQQISNINTEHAQLAYLSACSTADNSAQDLGDETIHLASGFQLAGFNHVLATMWKSQDKACLEVARGFYSVLFDIQENENGHRRVGTALHEAVKQVRDRRPDKPLTWAPFIHMGA